MRKLIIGLTVVFACTQKNVQQHAESPNTYDALELKSLTQLRPFDSLAFDLSGMVCTEDNYFVIADKKWNNFIYQIEFSSENWQVVDKTPLPTDYALDMEAIDFCGDTFYFADERSGQVFMKTPTVSFEPLNLDFSALNIDPESWGNAGWEGMALDCEQQLMYLIKERQPRFVVTVDLNTQKAVRKFTIPETESNDFSDAKFENGHLYLIERNGNYVAKIDVATQEVVDKYHYREVASHPNGKLYGPTKYGMAEALLLKENEIWIGLDNNGDAVTQHAKDTYQMSGNAPVILKFKRPEGF